MALAALRFHYIMIHGIWYIHGIEELGLKPFVIENSTVIGYTVDFGHKGLGYKGFSFTRDDFSGPLVQNVRNVRHL